LEEIITGKILFSPKNEYLRLNSNDFNSSFVGWTFKGTGPIDSGGDSSICGLQLRAFNSS